MEFHARLSPGVVTDATQPIDLVVHAPARCADVTIKLWELDVFRDPETGERRDEGTKDDLLAEFQGAIEPGPGARGARDWRRFVVASSRIVSDDPSLARFRLRLPGDEAVHEVPIVSEAGEVEGRAYELGLSIEHGGEERYRTTVPCLFAPPRLHPTVTRRRVAGRDDEGRPDPRWSHDERLSQRYLAIGTAHGEARPDGLGQTLNVLVRAWVDVHGQVVRRDEEGDEAAGQPVALRAGRPLFVHVHAEPDDVPLGPSDIPIAACVPVPESGAVVREEPSLEGLGFAVGLSALVEQAGGSPAPAPTLPRTFGISEAALERMRERMAVLRARRQA